MKKLYRKFLAYLLKRANPNVNLKFPVYSLSAVQANDVWICSLIEHGLMGTADGGQIDVENPFDFVCEGSTKEEAEAKGKQLIGAIEKHIGQVKVNINV